MLCSDKKHHSDSSGDGSVWTPVPGGLCGNTEFDADMSNPALWAVPPIFAKLALNNAGRRAKRVIARFNSRTVHQIMIFNADKKIKANLLDHSTRSKLSRYSAGGHFKFIYKIYKNKLCCVVFLYTLQKYFIIFSKILKSCPDCFELPQLASKLLLIYKTCLILLSSCPNSCPDCLKVAPTVII